MYNTYDMYTIHIQHMYIYIYLVVDGVRPTQKQVCHLEQPFYLMECSRIFVTAMTSCVPCGSITPQHQQLEGELIISPKTPQDSKWINAGNTTVRVFPGPPEFFLPQ